MCELCCCCCRCSAPQQSNRLLQLTSLAKPTYMVQKPKARETTPALLCWLPAQQVSHLVSDSNALDLRPVSAFALPLHAAQKSAPHHAQRGQRHGTNACTVCTAKSREGCSTRKPGLLINLSVPSPNFKHPCTTSSTSRSLAHDRSNEQPIAFTITLPAPCSGAMALMGAEGTRASALLPHGQGADCAALHAATPGVAQRCHEPAADARRRRHARVREGASQRVHQAAPSGLPSPLKSGRYGSRCCSAARTDARTEPSDATSLLLLRPKGGMRRCAQCRLRCSSAAAAAAGWQGAGRRWRSMHSHTCR